MESRRCFAKCESPLLSFSEMSPADMHRPVAAVAREIHVEMVLVVAIGARPKHGREFTAGAIVDGA